MTTAPTIRPTEATRSARGLLPVALVCVLTTAAAARGQVPQTARASGRTEVYVDDDDTLVVRPRVAASVPVSESVAVQASYMADVVSSASVDVITRATQGISETRHEGSLGVSVTRDRGRVLGVTYALGREPDYLSNAISVAVGRELDDAGLLALSTRLQLSISRVGTVADPRFAERLYGAALQTSLTRIVTQRLLVRGTLELGHLHGFQSSAYRNVRLGQWTAMRSDGSDPEEGEWIFTGVTGSALERHPRDRFRARGSFDAVVSLSDHLALAALVGAYVDSWRVASGEASFELRVEPRAGMLLRVGARGYVQSPAWFHRYRYLDVGETNGILTDDKELGPLRSIGGTVAGAFPIRAVTLDVRAELVRYAYPHLDMLPDKRALSIALGLTWRRP